MEKNMFENAYFGKAYKTIGGKKAIYWRHAYRHHLFTESGPMMCDDSGKFCSCCPDLNTLLDIVGEWEEVDEEKLDKLAREELNLDNITWSISLSELLEAYKDGYRKAKEEK